MIRKLSLKKQARGDGKQFIGSRERNIRAHSGWRLPITVCREGVSRVVGRVICPFVGHNWWYGAFAPVAVCKRCHTCIDPRRDRR